MEDLKALPVPESMERRRKLLALQVLRFFAAALVLLAHLEERLTGFADRYHVPVTLFGFNGYLGVDIFFVISGFIMGFLTLDRFGKPGAPGAFWVDRITRVAPFYWIMTMATVVTALLSNRLGDASRSEPLTKGFIIKSLIFLPYLDADGKNRPVLAQGWTLDYEMMFYGLFALCLFIRRPWGPIGLVIAFFCIYASGYLPGIPVPVKIWSDPIIFEFLIGFLLALLRARLQRLFPLVGQVWLLFAIVAIVSWMIRATPSSFFVNCAVATGLVALCTLFADMRAGYFLERGLVRLGDWSYSLYLTHGFVLLFVGIVWRKLFGAGGLWIYSIVVLTLSLVAAYAAHYLIERPSTALFRRLLRRLLREPQPVALGTP